MKRMKKKMMKSFPKKKTEVDQMTDQLLVVKVKTKDKRLR